MVSRRIWTVVGLFAFASIVVGTDAQVPIIWDDRALDDWARRRPPSAWPRYLF